MVIEETGRKWNKKQQIKTDTTFYVGNLSIIYLSLWYVLKVKGMISKQFPYSMSAKKECI